MIRKQRLCHDSLFKSMETKNVIELSAFEEFVNMYPSQCNIFKEIFKREFQVASQKIQKTKR